MQSKKTPLILSIETATRAGSIAISRGETLLAAQTGDAATSHSAHLLDSVKSVLDESGVTLKDVDFFAASIGPGSFTGLRIGLATVKSFAATMRRSCIGVQTLYAIAYAAGESERTLALLPAGRGEVFAQMLAVERNGNVHPLDSPTHIAPHKLLEKVKSETMLKWAGEGAQKHAPLIKAQALAQGISFLDQSQDERAEPERKRQWVIAPVQEILAVDVCKLAHLRVHSGEVTQPEQLRAIYVRPSDAELNEQ